MTTLQTQQNLPQGVQSQGVFPVSSINVDQMSMYTQAMPQTIMAQPNQMNFIVMPSMQPLDQSKQQQVGVVNSKLVLFRSSDL